MDIQLGLREVLFLAGLAVILLIIIDGVRRMRKSRQQAHQAQLDAQHELDLYNSELPRGGARKIDMDDVILQEEEIITVIDDIQEVDAQPETAPFPAYHRDVIMEPSSYSRSVSMVRTINPVPVDHAVPLEDDEWVEEARYEREVEEDKSTAPVEEIIIVTVMAKKGENFSGNSIVSAAKQAGLKHGERNIFHRDEQGGIGKRGHLFSMANVLEPGSFDLQETHKIRTPGVCFFLNLPGPKKSVLAFELLVDAARKMAKSLGGELQDGRRNVLTSKGLEQLRQRVVDFDKRHAPRASSMVH